ncbi:MAG: sigma 54-interacting transcriptional regulator [Deltaproteobacteria bacterium]
MAEFFTELGPVNRARMTYDELLDDRIFRRAFEESATPMWVMDWSHVDRFLTENGVEDELAVDAADDAFVLDAYLRCHVVAANDLALAIGRMAKVEELQAAWPVLAGSSPANVRRQLLRFYVAGGPPQDWLTSVDIPHRGHRVLECRWFVAPRRGELEVSVTSAVDRTAEHETLSKLRTSARRFASVINDQTEMIVRYRAGGVRTFVNDSYCRHFDEPRDALLGTSFLSFVAEEDRTAVLGKIASLVPDGDALREEHRVIEADGSVGWQEWIDRAITLEDGSIEYQAVGRDITDRVLAQQRYRMLVDRTPGMVWQADVDGRHVFVSSNVLRLTGFTSDEICRDPKLYFDRIHPRDVAMVRKAFRALFDNAEPLDVQYRWRRKDDSWVTIRDQATEVVEEAGLRTALGVGTDVTALEQTAEQLRGALEEITYLKQKAETETRYLRRELTREKRLDQEAVGDAPAWRNVQEEITHVAATDATVLITGETGTGKELVARAIHAQSPRSEGPLITLNAATLSGALLDSELFGHTKGAFTGATESRIGRFELAEGGTLFLDEVGELPLDTQAKLLRVLEDRVITPIGASESRPVDVRIVAATNVDLEEAQLDGRFRSDLFFRLSVFPIQVPPLRERAEDIPRLVEHFVDTFSDRYRRSVEAVDDAAMQALVAYAWPGNVRELQNLVERAVIRCQGQILRRTDFHLGGQPSLDTDDLEDVERRHIARVLQDRGWVIGGDRGAAKALGLHENTLRTRMKKLGIQRPG